MMTNFLFLISKTGSLLVMVRMGTGFPARVQHSVSFLMKAARAGSAISRSTSNIMSCSMTSVAGILPQIDQTVIFNVYTTINIMCLPLKPGI